MGPIQLVVFDLAGTTIDDDGGVVLNCLVETVHVHNLPGTSDELNALMGMNKREVFGMLAARRYPANSATAEALAEEALATFIAFISAAYERHLAPMPGAEEIFAFLRARGIKVAIDTGFDATVGGLIMQRLDWPGRMIDLAVFSSDVLRGRPAPYMIFRAMELLDVQDVHQVMKIGDTPSDLEEGYNAGCGEVIGVLSGAHTATTLEAYRHTRLLPSVADLLRYLPDRRGMEKLSMHSSATSTTRHTNVLVIGAGILGTFHAYYAAKKGYKTILLERNQFPSDASTRNFGMIVQTIVETDSEWSMFARASREIYQTIQAGTDITVKNPGSLYLASTETEQRVLQEFAATYASTYFCQYLDADESHARYPFVNASYCQGALHFPNDLSVEPRNLLRRLIPFVQQTGPVEYIPQTTIVAIETSAQGYRVRDARGNIFTAEHVFVCSGAEYRTLFPEFFQASGLRVCKLQMMQTVAQPQRILPHSLLSGLSIQRYPAFQSCPSYRFLQDQPVEEYIRDYSIHLLFKQAADGTVIIGDSHEYNTFEEANKEEEYTNCHINEVILRYGQRMITLPTWKLKTIWNGYYLIHPQRPIYSETIDGSIHIVTGIGGKGMSTGPGFAQKHIDTVFA